MNPATDSMSDFSVTACGRMTTADADAEADADADEMEVAEPGAGFNTVVTDLHFDFQACPKSQTYCRFALIYNRIVIDLLFKIQLQQC